MKPIRFTRGSRKHRIGRQSAYHVIAAMTAALTWIGADERGRELEIVAVEKDDCYLVIHVMPTHYREAGR